MMKYKINKTIQKITDLTFTKRYIFALTLIATLSILAYFNLTKLIDKQSIDSKILNISGKQRMLSQKIALFAIYYKTKELETHLELMKNSHDYLLSLKLSEELKDIYFSNSIDLDNNVTSYIIHGELFSKNRNGKSLTYILNNSQIILQKLDLAVSVYQKEAENRTKKLNKNELYILLFTLLVLFFEAIFIFRPVNKRIKKRTIDLTKQITFLNTITESNTNAIIAISKDLEVIIYNKSAVNIFGYSKEEMLKKDSLDNIIDPYFLKKHNKIIKSLLKTKIFRIKDKALELNGKRKNGEIFPIRVSFGTNNSIDDLIVVANIQDITEEKLREKQLLEQSRYAAMGEMIGNIAHQWRQPLSAISSIASGSSISRELELLTKEETITNFDKIKNHTLYLSHTIDDFRNFFKTEASNKEFKIDSSIKSAISLTQALFKNNEIALIYRESNEDLKYVGRSNELSQVIMNILHNAKDVIIEKKIINRMVVVNLFRVNKKIIIEINDSAGGIAKDIMNKIFEPYFTTKHNSQGTGIGLFMSKEIIEKHFGGKLSVSNKEFIINDKNYFGASFRCEINI